MSLLPKWASSFLLVLLSLLTLPAFAQQPDPEVDWTEVSRWGDRVIVSGEGPQAVDSYLFSLAMAPPDDDSDMWYVTVWGMKTCPACTALVKAFEKDDNLTPFVAVPPGKKKAWAHFNYYQFEDPTQKWRFKDFKVEAGPFPIITIQPPRNKMFGDPRVVVDRIEAKDWNNTRQLKNRITSSVEKYCKKLRDSGFVPPADLIQKRGHAPLKLSNLVNVGGAEYGHGQQPNDKAKDNAVIGGPWGPDPPSPVPFNPQYPSFPSQGPGVTPAYPPAGGGLFDGLLSGESGTFFLMLLAVLKLIETVGPWFGFDTALIKRIRETAEKMKPATPIPGPVPVNPQPVGLANGYVLLTDGRIVPGQ